MDTKDEILAKDLSSKDDKIKGSFSKDLKFGTSGIRALMGAGTDRINEFTVAAIAKAYSKYIKAIKTNKNIKIVIGHDNRHNGKLFAEVAAQVLQANGIKSFLFENNEAQPSSLLSYTLNKGKFNGGIYITASHNSKDYNGVKLFDKNGSQLISSETNKITKIFEKLNPLKIKKNKWVSNFINNDVIEKYKKGVLAIQLNGKLNTELKTVFSPLQGTTSSIGSDLLKQMGIDTHIVTKQNEIDSDFSNSKVLNPSNGKAFAKSVTIARKIKADSIIIADPDGGRIGVAVKYQRRLKFLNTNQLAALYLDYKLSQLKRQKKLPENGYIVTTVVSSVLTKKIAEKFGIKVYESLVGFKNISNLIKSKSEEKFLFAYEESAGFLLNNKISNDKDSLQTIVGVTDMLRYYKSKNINAYDKLQSIYKTFNIHRTVQSTMNISDSQKNKIFKKLLKIKKFSNHKVVEAKDFRQDNAHGEPDLVKITFKNSSSIAVRSSGVENQLKVYIENVGKKGEEMLQLVAFEKEVSSWIKGQSAEFGIKKFSMKTVFKYLVFTSIIAAILVFVFLFVYKTTNTSGKDIEIFTVVMGIFNAQSRWVWLSIWIWMIFRKFLYAWMGKRIYDKLGEKVRVRDLVIAAVMGAFISFVTPFAVGGDAIGYWYLRRKKIKASSIISVAASTTIWGEVKFALQTILLVGIGWVIYKDIFDSGDAQSHGALIWFFVGLIWSWFAAFMILLLTMNRKFQEFIVRNATKLLEWMPFYHLYDPDHLKSGYQYNFLMLRTGMRRIWTDWKLVLEITFYDLIPMFAAPLLWVYKSSNMIRPGFPGGYWSQVVAGDIKGTANSMSLLPGGSGTGEWLSVTINKHIYTGSLVTQMGVKPTTFASGNDLFWKVFYSWPDLVLSVGTIGTVLSLQFVKTQLKRRILVLSSVMVFIGGLIALFMSIF